MANPIRFSDLFDFTSDKDVLDAIQKIKSLDKVYSEFIKNSKSLKTQYVQNMQEVIKATDLLHKTVIKLNPTLQQDQQQLAATSKSMDILTAISSNLQKKTATLGTTINTLEKEQKAFNARAKEAIRLEKEEEKLKAKLISLDKSQAQNIEKLKIQIQERNKAMKQAAKESLGLVSIYDRESKRLAELAKRYKDYVVSGRQGTKEARALKREHDQLRSSIVKADAAIGQFNRNVGNYTSALKGMALGVRQVASALGFTGVIFALVGAFRSAFNSIREFDKEMVNMAAIAGENREEFAGVEMEIRRVAKTSVNTATEVAKTATALITLGKTKSEIVDLLEPVNSLSIALQAPADAAGELLIQTLNAFGKSSESAQEYADIIAKMRTSTALDFERIKDSLGFLAPVAKAVGLDLAETGGILGTLVDNGIKAARAGRLMSTSFGRLAQMGISLEEALERINSSSDKTTTAMDLFGAESFSLALILAENTDKMDAYTKSFRDAGGTLKELTDKQLKSMDAQLKILGSTWEEFVFSIENGQGALSRFASGFIEAMGNSLRLITAFNDGIISSGELIGALTNPAMAQAALIKIAAQESIKAAKEQQRQQEINTEASEIYNFALKNNIKSWKDLQQVEPGRLIKNQALATEILNEVQSKFNKSNQESIKIQRDGVKAASDLSKEYDKLDESIDFVFESSEDIVLGAMDVRGSFKALQSGTGELSDAIDEYGKSVDESFVVKNSEAEESFSRLEKFILRVNEKVKNLGLIISTAFDSASTAVNQFFTNQDIKRENSFVKFENQQQSEIEALEERRERELSNENLTAEAKEAINRRYADSINDIESRIENKRKDVQRKQARAEKQQALFNAIINTAQAIIEGLLTGGPILAAAYGVIGATQIAAIASQPLPAFAKGTDNAPGGLAMVGEEGQELVMEPSGKTYLTGHGAELRDIPKGSQILTNVITERILRQGSTEREAEAYNISSKRIQRNASEERIVGIREAVNMTMQRENGVISKSIEKAIAKIPVHIWSFDEKGALNKAVRKGNTTHLNVELENKY